MSRLTSLTIALAAAVFLSVPHLATAAEDGQRARARTRSPGRTASAPAQTSRGGSRRAPAVRSGGSTRSAPARQAPTARSGQKRQPSRSGTTTTQRQAPRRAPTAATRSEARAPKQTAPSRRAPVVRRGGQVTTVDTDRRPEPTGATRAVRRVSPGSSGTTSATTSTRTRQRAPASSGVTRTTQTSQRNASRATPQRRVVGTARTEAETAGTTARAAVRRRPGRVVEVDATRQTESARRGAVRVGSSTRTQSAVRDVVVTQKGSVVHTATARPSRQPAGRGNIVGKAVPRASVGGTFSGGVGTRGRGYVSGRGTTSSYGYRYPYDGGRVRFGRSTRHYGRPYYPSYSYRPRFYGASYYPRYGFNLGLSFGSVYPGYGYYSPGYPYGYTSYGYGQSYASPYMGSLRLKVKPRDAEVFVDGYYVGLVDHFDGFAQRLRLEEGTYQIEIRHPAYLPIALDVLITAGETVTFEEQMIRP